MYQSKEKCINFHNFRQELCIYKEDINLTKTQF